MDNSQIISQNGTTKTPIEIALKIDEDGYTTASKLYSFLELSPSNYSKWCKASITENEFAEENVDFVRFVLKYESAVGEKEREDFKLTARFAKKLSMKGNGERAEQAREYFTRIEEKTKEMAINRQNLSPTLQMVYALADQSARVELEQKRQAEKIEQIEKKQDKLTETFAKTSDTEDFQKWCKNCVSKIANSTFFMNCFPNADRLRYEKVWQESYERLKQKRTCRLNQRVAYARRMALKNGATKSQADKISILYIISADNDLKPIYETVIKEMMICYCV